jgi:hypothetical protein
MNIIIFTCRHPQKFNVPNGGQHEPNHNNIPRESSHCEKLTESEQVHDAPKRQRRHEVRSTPIAEVP